MKIVLIALAIVLVPVALVVLIGAMLPVAHRAQRTAQMNKPPAVVYAVLAGPPEWQPGRKVPIEQIETDPPRKLVTRISDKSLPFGGTWTYDLKPSSEGTELTITEDGEVYNPLFRFVSKFMIGHTATIDQYIDALKKKLG